MTSIIIVAIIAAVVYYFYYLSHGNHKNSEHSPHEASSQPTHFELLDDNGDPIRQANSDAPVLELQYFCIKDKGYHVSVWPKNQRIGDYEEFTIAGLSHRDNIDDYLGEFKGTLEAEPTNQYDPNAIKVLATDGHHVGYVPSD